MTLTSIIDINFDIHRKIIYIFIKGVHLREENFRVKYLTKTKTMFIL